MSEMKEAEKAAAQEARSALVERVRHAKRIDLHAVEWGKYFRLVAEVIADGENLSDVLRQKTRSFSSPSSLDCQYLYW